MCLTVFPHMHCYLRFEVPKQLKSKPLPSTDPAEAAATLKAVRQSMFISPGKLEKTDRNVSVNKFYKAAKGSSDEERHYFVLCMVRNVFNNDIS